MEWFAMSSKFYIDLDDQGVSEAAQTLLMRVCGYIADNETGGYIAKSALKKLGLSRLSRRVDELIGERIMIETVDGSGYNVPAWPKWNGPLERQVKKRKADRERIAEKRAEGENVARHQRDKNAMSHNHIDSNKNKSGYLERERYVSNAPANESPNPSTPPEPRCPQHLHNPTTAACRPCGDARRARQTWDTEQERARKLAVSESARQSALARSLAIADCGMCDDEGYLGTTVCDHDPSVEDRVARGSAKVRAALRKGA
ncbi:hypothetical protein GS474_15945 [Rhodococcus hoagii]|nr:hypothetical protein [Prescottella equi]